MDEGNQVPHMEQWNFLEYSIMGLGPRLELVNDTNEDPLNLKVILVGWPRVPTRVCKILIGVCLTGSVGGTKLNI